MSALTAIWPWARQYWRYAAVALVATLCAVAINLSIPVLTQRIIDDGIVADDGGVVARIAFLMIGLIVASMIFSAIASALGVRFSFHTVTDMRRDLFGKTQSFSFGNLDRLTSGEILTRLTSDVSKVTVLMSMSVSFLAQIPIMFIGALVAILAIDASLLVVVLIMLPATALVVWFVIVRSTTMYDLLQRRIDRLNTVLQEGIHGVEVIKAFVRQDHEQERFDATADDLAKQAIAVNQLVAGLFPTLILFSSLGIAAVLWLGGGNVIDGQLTKGELVAFVSYMSLLAFPMIMFTFLQPMMSAAAASMDRIKEVLSEDPDVTHDPHGTDLAEQDEPGLVEFRNVSFCYRSTEPGQLQNAALRDINVRIEPGTTVAILGSTGSGKSTLVQLVPRFYNATDGQVLVGGVDVQKLSRSSLRRNVAIALQEPQLFSGSVMENLRFGRPDATDEEVVAAAVAAQAHPFISALEDGYDSAVAQGGANLSGGQRQRLAIARTLIADPEVLILDDSTSAVDLETEALIQEALEAWADRTIILVAQRISTALGADEIIVMDAGRVVGHGTHEELLANNTIYGEIFRSQLGEPAT